MRTSARWACAAGLAAAFGFTGAGAAIIVGPGCRVAELQQAIDEVAASDGFIDLTQDYHGDPVHIDGVTVHITGGVESCTNPTVVGTSTLDGSSTDAAGAVITLSGSAQLDLRNVEVTGGHNPGGNGGGISFSSAGTRGYIELHEVSIHGNHADRGAGLYFDGAARDDDLVLDRVMLSANLAAQAGGGVSLLGNTRMTMNFASSIGGNSADPANTDAGRGGGLELAGHARALINGSIVGNRARIGGGIAMQDFGVAQLSGTTASLPVVIGQNHASAFGGGVWGGGTSALCPRGFSIDENEAPDGAAIGMVDQASIGGQGEQCQDIGNGLAHNTVDDNVASDTGSIIAAANEMFLSTAAIVGNRGGILIKGAPAPFVFELVSSEIHHNAMHRALTDYVALVAIGSTVADNTLDEGAPLFSTVHSEVDLNDSIIWQPGVTMLTRSGSDPSTVSFSNLLTADPAAAEQADAVANLIVGTDPLFAAPERGDYSLQPDSVGIDDYVGCTSSSSFGHVSVDEFGHTRGVVIRAADTPCDLGAIEFTGNPTPGQDPIFADGFDG